MLGPVLVAALLHAQPDRTDGHLELTTSVAGWSAMPLDELGTRLDRTLTLDARVRVGGRVVRGDATLELELDVIDGQVAGERTALGTVRGVDTLARRRDRWDGVYGLLPRTFSLRVTTPYGVGLVGATTADWGLGIVANAGRDDGGFGAPTGGNAVVRAGFATRPLSALSGLPPALSSAVVAASLDLVQRDDHARLVDGDVAVGAALAARIEGEHTALHLLASGRLQRDRATPEDPGGARRRLEVLTLDAFARARLPLLPAPWTLTVSGEAAVVRGRTDRALVEATQGGLLTVASAGALVRLELARDDRLALRVDAGWASGDGDPYDAAAEGFRFNSAHRVGLVLFRELLPMMAARAIDRAADPGRVGRPASGLRALATDGAVGQANYLYPTARVRLADPLEVRAGYLLAATSADWVDPYLTARAGGYAVGPAGARTGVALIGQEVLLGLHLRWPLPAGELGAVVEGALALPGPTLRALGMEASWLGRAGLSWRVE